MPLEAVRRRRGAPDTAPAAHPVVVFAFEQKRRLGLTYEAWSAVARLPQHTLAKWKTTSIPRVDRLEQALLPLGYEIWVRPVGKKSRGPAIGRASRGGA